MRLSLKQGAPAEHAAFHLRDVKLAGGSLRAFQGYGSIFGNIDAHGDAVAPRAFRRSLAEHAAAGTMPAMLSQHGDWTGSGDGMMPVGRWTVMREDAKGLYVEGVLSDTPRGNEAYTLLKDGALTGLSIGYQVRSATRGTKPGEPARTLTDVELIEVSLVTFPANGLARVTSVKTATGQEITQRDCERILRDAGLSRELAKGIIARGWRATTDQRDADGEAEHELVEAVKATTATLTTLKARLSL